MNNQPNEQLDELLARATEALRDGQPSDAPPPELVASTTERMRLLDSRPRSTTVEPDTVRLAERRQFMFRIASYSSAVAAAIVVAVFSWLLFNDQGKPAFAGVIENVKEAKSVTLTNLQTIGKQPPMLVKWYIEGNKLRMELPGAVAYVADIGANSVYELNLKQKTARPLGMPASQQAVSNPVSYLQNAKSEDASPAGKEQLDGQTVQVYRIDKIDFLGAKAAGEMKVWVNPESSLPVKISLDQPQKERGSRNTIVLKDFEWNKDLDDSLFQVPADFTIEEAQAAPN